MAYHVSKMKFGQLVEAALAGVPAEFAAMLEEVSVEIRDVPGPAELAAVGVGPGRLLLGLYRGRPRTRRSVEESGYLPDTILIFQSSIEAVCRNEAELVEQVRKTVLHELGHHFGMDEGDLSELGYS